MFTLRLLVVESSKGLQAFVRQLFENFGFDPELIKTASSPQAALAVAHQLKPDFLLTDWFADGSMNGLDLYQKVLQFNPDCRFALLSADTGAEKTEAAKSAGALFLQHKPCSASDLRAALGSALQHMAKENPKVNKHVSEMTSAAARHLAALTQAAKTPHFTPGEKVFYRGKADSIRNVILSKGQMTVQLEGVAGLVPSGELTRA